MKTHIPLAQLTKGKWRLRYLVSVPAAVILGLSSIALSSHAQGPELSYMSLVGGEKTDMLAGGALDSNGDFWVTGITTSPEFLPDLTLGGPRAFLSRLDPSGAVIETTAFGGADFERPWAIGIDQFGHIYVVGTTWSKDFPTTPTAFQPSYGGGATDGFIVRYSADGQTIQYASYLGGSGDDSIKDIAFGPLGNVVVTGATTSVDLPITADAVQPSFGGGYDVFVAKFLTPSSDLAFITYLGGSGDEGNDVSVESSLITPGYVRVATDKVGNIYVIGDTGSRDFPVSAGALQTTYGGGTRDTFLTKLDPGARRMIYSTFIGGSALDFAGGVVTDVAGRAIFSATTESADHPTERAHMNARPGIRSGILGVLEPDGSAAKFITYLGGPGGDTARALALDGSGKKIFVTGATKSPEWSYQSTTVLTAYDVYLAEISTEGVFRRVTQYESIGNRFGLSIDVGGSSDVHIVGICEAPCGEGQTDGLAMRIEHPAPAVRVQTSDDGAGNVHASFWVENKASTSVDVHLYLWYEGAGSGEIPLIAGGLAVTLPAGLPFVPVMTDQYLAHAQFPGAALKARLTAPASGAILSEAVCLTANCQSW